jgi:hypothetical protein
MKVAGEAGELVDLQGDLLQVIAAMPIAPGQPVELEVEDMRLDAKSRGTKKRDDGRFDLKVRLVAIRREERQRLEALLS